MNEREYQPIFYTINQYYNELIKKIGNGANPTFQNAPEKAIVVNLIGDEKPIAYVYDQTGTLKRWLEENDIEAIRDHLELEEREREALLFDMFSFMVGGCQPNRQELGAERWVDLLVDIDPLDKQEAYDKASQVLAFIDEFPRTNLTEDIANYLGVSHQTGASRFEVVTPRGRQIVLIGGQFCYSRGKIYAWHTIRNSRTLSTSQIFSPVRADGGLHISQSHDIQVAYVTPEGIKTGRINMSTFLLARHRFSEQTTDQTAADQIYLSLTDYKEHFYIDQEADRHATQEVENENFIIRRKTLGYKQLQIKRRKKLAKKLIEAAAGGLLDDVLQMTEQFRARNQSS